MPLRRSPCLLILLILTALAPGCMGFQSETVLVPQEAGVRIPELLNGVYYPFEPEAVDRVGQVPDDALPEPDGLYALAWDPKEERYAVFIGQEAYLARCRYLADDVFLMMLTDLEGEPTERGGYLYLVFKIVDRGLFQLFDQDCDLSVLDRLEEEWTVEVRSASEYGGDILEGSAEAILPMLYALQERMRGCGDNDIHLAHESLLMDPNWERLEIDPRLRGLNGEW